MTIESLHAVKELEKIGMHCDLIDLRTTSPLDFEAVRKSVKKTGKLIAVDSSSKSFSVASEIIADCSIATEKLLLEESTAISLPVFLTDFLTASKSKGLVVLKSIKSQCIPIFSNSLTACKDSIVI
jgi:pyruvate dehydrogenase E1 component beta subunit